MALPTVTLTGTYTRPDGNPLRGWVDLCPPSTLTYPDEPTFVACCARARLDEDGSFRIELVATDALGGNVANWQYRVEENLDCPSGQRTYYIELPATTTEVDLAQLAPTTRPTQLRYLRLPGPPGPAADPAGAVLSLAPTLLKSTAPTALPFETEASPHGVRTLHGRLLLPTSGLWAFAATLRAYTPLREVYTVRSWLEWEEGERVYTGPVREGRGQGGDPEGFDVFQETLAVLPAHTPIRLYADIEGPAGDEVIVEGRAGTGALLLRTGLGR